MRKLRKQTSGVFPRYGIITMPISVHRRLLLDKSRRLMPTITCKVYKRPLHPPERSGVMHLRKGWLGKAYGAGSRKVSPIDALPYQLTCKEVFLQKPTSGSFPAIGTVKSLLRWSVFGTVENCIEASSGVYYCYYENKSVTRSAAGEPMTQRMIDSKSFTHESLGRFKTSRPVCYCHTGSIIFFGYRRIAEPREPSLDS
ncbi:uncharacterized protein LOC118507175 isoform X2 [Anopheles stephensi]|uniref:uncharacterized protein LOC118507175 isoform X2 n=1 Tax=Anopheles stephensi TaxID=30069 RepID=UPI001658889F|nr:uncharacterized protein LOC118507175 isoform X2 [Anopheles stephensi]